MRRGRSCWLTLLLIVGLMALPVVVGLLAFNYLVTSAKHSYYTRHYYVTDLDPAAIGEHPAEFRLTNVPWYSTRESYCATTALRMVVAQRGKPTTLGELNFLSGFTYGITQIPDKLGFSPYSDPETGLVVAAPYFGLKRIYYVTENEADFLDGIRHQLSRGRPVRVALDMALLYDRPGQIPHTELLVGYDAEGFEYYEPVCDGVAPCETGEKAPGAPGIRMSTRQLADSVVAQSRQFGYPWTYAYTVFEPADSSLSDLASIWQRNGVSLIGQANEYGPRYGSEALKVTAALVEDQATRADLTWLTPGLESAVYTRRDNVAFLRARFDGDAEVDEAAGLLARAADEYERALFAARDGIADRAEAGLIATALRAAAEAEREAGEIFAAQAPQPTPNIPPQFEPFFAEPAP